MNSTLVPTVICPGCRAELEVHRETCPHCRSSLRVEGGSSLPHSSPTDAGAGSALDRPWVIAVLMLHVGFLGIPLYWKARYSVRTRLILCLVSVLYTVFAVGVIVGVGTWLLSVFRGG